jgi:hypothetical protein
VKELDQRLRAAGKTPVPPPDPAFAARLEERLRAGVLAPEPVLRPARPARPTTRHWSPVVAVAAALAAVLGGVGVLRDSGPSTVRVTSPASTPPPVESPEQPAATTTSTVTTLAPQPPVTTSTTKPAVTTSTTKPTTRATTKPTTESTTKTTTKPVTQPIEPKPTTTTSGPAALRLESRYKDSTAKLQWSGYGGKDFAAYLVLRADGPAEPAYPADRATTVVATITSQWSVSFMETISDPPGRRYRVVAVDSERRLIATSPAVTPQPFA